MITGQMKKYEGGQYVNGGGTYRQDSGFCEGGCGHPGG